MSRESAASGSSTYRPGSARAGGGGFSLADLLASLFGRQQLQPGQITFDPTLPSEQQTVAPGKGDPQISPQFYPNTQFGGPR